MSAFNIQLAHKSQPSDESNSSKLLLRNELFFFLILKAYYILVILNVFNFMFICRWEGNEVCDQIQHEEEV